MRSCITGLSHLIIGLPQLSILLQSFIHIIVGLAVENFCINVEAICQGLVTSALHSMAHSTGLQMASSSYRMNLANR